MIRIAWFVPLVFAMPLAARDVPPLPPELSAYVLEPAPGTKELLLEKGDRLAICGDSITEQKQYSLLMETYLTACMPHLEISARQFGWSGEKAEGFSRRMENDVLRFKPDVATTCYGMNDFRYVPFEEKIGEEYRVNLTKVVDAFQKAGTRVVLGSPGIIDSVPHWVKNATGTQQDLNLSLARFRNIGVEIAKAEQTAFADVYRPMLLADLTAKKQYGPDFKVSGKDGVHPNWAGHVVMAHAFFKGLGLNGDLGSVSYDDRAGKATGTGGHEVLAADGGTITVRSARLAFAPGAGALDSDDSIRAGLALVPFDDELNRFMFRIVSPRAETYTVSWGGTSRTYQAAQLEAGINLAKDFADNPMVPAFNKVREAVAKKQEYETRQIKSLVHGPEGAADMEATIALTEKARAPLEKAVRESLKPVEHVIVIAPATS